MMTNYNRTEPFKDITFINDISSMAVIGTSARRDFFFLRNHQAHFQGDLYAINPKIKKIPGFDDGTEGKIYPSVKEVPGNVDFVFITVSPNNILEIIDDCVEKGVKLASIFTAEFSDAGTKEGRELEIKLLEHAKGKLRILGPNGMGLYYPKLGIAWRPKFPSDQGKIGFIAQSGGICNIAIYSSQELEFNFSKVFSFGNGADLDFVDLFHYLSNDPETNIILGYIEGLSEGRGKALQKALKLNNKPFAIVKGGKSKRGSLAAQTHTASLTGTHTIWKALFKQYGVIEVESIEQLLNIARLIECYGLFHMTNIAILSISGGYGVILVDLLEKAGFKVPSFSDHIQDKLDKKFFTLGTSSSNPLDVSAQIYNSESIYDIIEIALSDDKIDGLIMDLPTWYFNMEYHLTKDENFEPTIIKAFDLGHKHNKPLIPIIQQVNCPEDRVRIIRKLSQRHICAFSSPEEIIPLLQKISNQYDRKNNSLKSLINKK
jgi:acyl-CoA synthetase (NDP forming)